jgi:uncharacterized protein YwgA
MDRQQILLAKALEAAELPLSVATFEDRLILQKTVYLLQSAGVHLGYRFRWYLRGPYSPDMTAGAFGIVREGNSAQEELRGWKLDDASKGKIDRLKSLFSASVDRRAQARRLELLASVLFLMKTNQAKPNEPEETSKILRRYSKHYHAQDVRDAVEELKGYGLL